MTDNLQYLLNAQEALQTNTYGRNIHGLAFESGEHNRIAAIDQIRTNILAATDELHEVLRETGWKPWATSNHINLLAAREELVDVFHFILNLALILGLDSEDITDLYIQKRDLNIKRQVDGYTGVK